MKFVGIRLDEEILKVLKARAKKNSLPLSTYLRQLIAKGMAAESNERPDKAMLEEILFAVIAIRKELALACTRAKVLTREDIQKCLDSAQKAVTEFLKQMKGGE